jgi:chromosome segregation ATPase
MKTVIFRAGLPLLGAVAVSLLAGCSSVSEVTKDRVARGETTVQQAQQTVGNSESGAVELQRARDNLQQAKAALNKKEAQKAERYAQLAELDGELAVAKSQSAAARNAANEVLASLKTLREEAARGSLSSEQ